MAKDGTLRGGARIGAGRPKQNNSENNLIEFPTLEVAELQGEDIPPPKEYLSAEQEHLKKSLTDEELDKKRTTYAVQIYNETYAWLKACKCDNLVTKQQIENFAQIMARQIQCEEALDKYGFLSKHPTTGSPIASPFVKMSLDYMRQATNLWLQIYNVVKQNFSRAYKIGSANDNMERLLGKIRRVK